jgi:hypothetical protein
MNETQESNIIELDAVRTKSDDDGPSMLLPTTSRSSTKVEAAFKDITKTVDTKNHASSVEDETIFSRELLTYQQLDLDYKNPLTIYSEQDYIDSEFVQNLAFEGTYAPTVWGTTLSIMCYRDADAKTMYCFYRSFKSQQTRLLNYCFLCLANLGLISFLIQVFRTRDWLSLFIVTAQVMFLIVCVIQLCVLRWVFARILKKFRKSRLNCTQITTIAFVRADNLCLEIDINSLDTDDDLSYQNTYKATIRWTLLVLVQILTLAYFIVCMVGYPPDNIND